MDQTAIKSNTNKGSEIFDRVLTRVANVLTPIDLETIKILDEKDDERGSLVENFLKAKIPNFDSIMQEEMDVYTASQKS